MGMGVTNCTYLQAGALERSDGPEGTKINRN